LINAGGIIGQQRKSGRGALHRVEQATMQRRAGFLSIAAGTTALLALVAAAPAEDGAAAFARRQDTMKHLGRPFYLGIGRVVKGTAPYGADTVSAAETLASLAGTLDQTLFPPGSNVGESKIKPEIFSAKEQVDQLIAAVKTATARLVPAVKTGDKAAIAAAYASVNDACSACHKKFRTEE
jgi:cytochrome c556